MKFWTTPKGEKLTFSQFMDRWRKGIEGLTPLQIVNTNYHSLKLVFIGIILGLIFSVMAFKQLYWLFFILLGSFGITISQWVAVWQKKKALEEIEKSVKEMKRGYIG
jgi:hypothetical protein